jgi:hypothetical protein
MVQPPGWVGRVFNSGGEISFTANCSGGPVPVTATGGNGSQPFWNLNYSSRPRENWIMAGTASVVIQISASRYANLAAAEKGAQQAFTNLAKQQAELAKRKLEAMAELEREKLRQATGPFKEFWADKLQKISDDLGKFVEDTYNAVKDDPLIPSDIKQPLGDLKDKWNTGKAYTDFFLLMAKADDPNLTDVDRLLAVKKAFDLGRALGPGGNMAAILNPYFDFISQSLDAIAVAIPKIEEMRKNMVLSTGDCSLIDAFIADAAYKQKWQNACKLRELLQKVRDP